jgi:hypothetical protein
MPVSLSGMPNTHPNRKGWYGVDAMTISVGRDEIESLDIENSLRIFQRLYNPQAARQFCERVRLAFRGYELDVRALYVIPEVREWIRHLDKAFPYWFFFLDKRMSASLYLVTLCLCPSAEATDQGPKVAAQEVEKFIATRLPSMKEACAMAGFSGRETQQLTDHLGAYYSLWTNRTYPQGSFLRRVFR